MPAEIAEAGGRGARDDGQAARQRRQRQLRVHLEHPLFLQPGDGPLAGQLQFADGKGRIDVVDDQRQAVQDRIGNLDPDQHRHAGREGAAGLRFEIRPDHPPGRSPDDGRHLGQQGVGFGIFFHQGQIAVTRRILLQFADFGLQPHRVEKSVFERLFHPLLQGHQTDGFSLLHIHNSLLTNIRKILDIFSYFCTVISLRP